MATDLSNNPAFFGITGGVFKADAGEEELIKKKEEEIERVKNELNSSLSHLKNAFNPERKE